MSENYLKTDSFPTDDRPERSIAIENSRISVQDMLDILTDTEKTLEIRPIIECIDSFYKKSESERLGRLLYSEISVKIFSSSSDIVDNIQSNCEQVIQQLREDVLEGLSEFENTRHFYLDILERIYINFLLSVSQGIHLKENSEKDFAKKLNLIEHELHEKMSDINHEVEEAKKTLKSLRTNQDAIDQRQNLTKLEQAKIKQEQNEIKQEQKEMTTQYTAILGIFATVVLAMQGGLQFFSDSFVGFQNLKSSEIFHYSILLIIVGLVLLNIIFLLVYLILFMADGKRADKFQSVFKWANIIGGILLVMNILVLAF